MLLYLFILRYIRVENGRRNSDQRAKIKSLQNEGNNVNVPGGTTKGRTYTTQGKVYVDLHLQNSLNPTVEEKNSIENLEKIANRLAF